MTTKNKISYFNLLKDTVLGSSLSGAAFPFEKEMRDLFLTDDYLDLSNYVYDKKRNVIFNKNNKLDENSIIKIYNKVKQTTFDKILISPDVVDKIIDVYPTLFDGHTLINPKNSIGSEEFKNE